MRVFQALSAAALALLFSLGCGRPLAAETLPPHEVLSVEMGEARRVVSVRLPGRVSEDDLARIAGSLRKVDEALGRRTLVNFYLPGMRLNDTCWASASFSPQIKITVNGLTLDEESAFRAAAASEKRAAVGMWLTQAPAAAGLIVIYRDKGHTYADWRLRGGHRTVEEVTESRGPHGRRFDIVGDANQHYVIVSGGALELREKAGLIALAEPIKPATSPLAGKDANAKPAAPTTLPLPAAQTSAAANAPAPLMRPVTSQSGMAASGRSGFTITDTEAAPPVPEPLIAQKSAEPEPAAVPPRPPLASKHTPVAKAQAADRHASESHKALVKAQPTRSSKPESATTTAVSTYKYPTGIADAARRFMN